MRPVACVVMPERTMPVCCTEAQHRIITEYAKRHGMTDASQAVESLLDQDTTNMSTVESYSQFQQKIHRNENSHTGVTNKT